MWKYCLALALLVGCTPERDPFALAPLCPQTEWCGPAPEAPCKEDCAICPYEGQLLDLADLLNIALCNSPNTRVTWANARAAAAEYGQSRASFYPDINGDAYYQLDRIPEYYSPGDVNTEDLKITAYHVTVDWLLWDFGARDYQACGFRDALLGANFTHNREVQTVLNTVMTDYYAYLADKEQVAADREDLLDARTNLDATVIKRIAGISDIQDEMQARTEVAQKRLALLRDEQMLEDALAQLAEDLGIPASLPLCIEGLPKKVQLAKICEGIEQLLSTAFCCRPDLLAAYADVSSKQAFVQEAWRNQMPTITFTGDIGRTSYNGTIDRLDYTADLRLDLPIFKGFWYQNKVRQAKAELTKARAELRKVELGISKDVVTAYKNLKLAAKMVKASEVYVESATITYEAVLKNYKVGTTDFTSLMSALANLSDSRASLVSSRKDWYTLLSDLAYATGTLSRSPPCRRL